MSDDILKDLQELAAKADSIAGDAKESPAPSPAPASTGYVPLIDLVDIEDPAVEVNALHFHGGDPNYVYAWLNTRPEMLEANKMRFGYEVCKSDDPIRTLAPPNDLGERKVADVILCRLAKHRYDKLVKLQHDRTIASIKGPHEQWIEKTDAAGIPTVGTTSVKKVEGL